MKKKIILLLTFALMCLPLITYAYTQTLQDFNPYSISSGQAVVSFGQANYKNAKVYTDVTGQQDGIHKTKFVFYKKTNGSYTKKASKVVSYDLNTCNMFTVKSIGKGAWMMENISMNNNTIYAGWSGVLRYYSVS